MTHVGAFIAGIVSFLAVLAIVSRLAQMPESPQLIKNFANMLASLFNGAFT